MDRRIDRKYGVDDGDSAEEKVVELGSDCGVGVVVVEDRVVVLY